MFSTPSSTIFCKKTTVKTEPFPTTELTVIVPPIISTKLFVIAKPSPTPSMVESGKIDLIEKEYSPVETFDELYNLLKGRIV